MAEKAIKNMVYSAGIKNAGVVRIVRPIHPKPDPMGVIEVELCPATGGGKARAGIWDFRQFVEQCIDILNSLTDSPVPLPAVSDSNESAEKGGAS